MQVWELMQVLGSLPREYATLEVIIAGDGGYEGDTRAVVEDLVGQHIRFFGVHTGPALVIT